MSEYVYAGETSQTIDLFLQDSSSTTGQGLSGLVFNSAGLVASYRKGATGSRAALSLATQTVGGAWSSGGFVEIDATNMKGVYRLDLPNVAVDTEGFVTLFLYGATNLLPTALRIDCRALPVDVKKYGGTAGTFASGIPEVKVASMASNTLTAAAISADAGAELAALVETYIVNEGDATAVMQAIADNIAADWVAGDASPLAVAAAVWGNGTRTITGGVLTTSPPTAAVIADAVWDEARSGHVTAGTFGENVVAVLDSATGTKIDSILEDTGTTLPEAIAATATPAQVNAQMLDVLTIDTFGELGSPPAAASSLKDKLVWLFMWARNKATATSSQRKLFADDTTTVVSTETIEDDGVTFTKGESL